MQLIAVTFFFFVFLQSAVMFFCTALSEHFVFKHSKCALLLLLLLLTGARHENGFNKLVQENGKKRLKKTADLQEFLQN